MGEPCDETMRLFAVRWTARLDREEAHRVKLAKAAFFDGLAVARGEMTIERANKHLDTMGAALDPEHPYQWRIRLLAYEEANAIASEAFYAGLRRGQGER